MHAFNARRSVGHVSVLVAAAAMAAACGSPNVTPDASDVATDSARSDAVTDSMIATDARDDVTSGMDVMATDSGDDSSVTPTDEGPAIDVPAPTDSGRDVTTSDAATDGGASTGVLIGMSTARAEWNQRLAEVGGVDARRLFDDLASSSSTITLARSELMAGRMPILSFKLPGNDWAGAAAGNYDSQLRALATSLAALPGRVFVTIHHEPMGDGTPAAYAAMQRHVLPILSPPANVEAGVIVNGFWWSAMSQGMTDAEISQWLPADVLALAEIVAADTYQGGTNANPGEDAGVKIRRMSAWAARVGVTRLGIGEFNGLDAPAIRAAGDAVLADPHFVFASCFNSSQNNAPGVDWVLTGARLTEFQNLVSRSRTARGL